MKRLSLLIIGIMGLCLSLSVGLVYGMESWGRVNAMSGEVAIEREGRTILARVGLEIRSEDRIVTGENATVTLAHASGAIFVLNADGEVEVDTVLTEADEPGPPLIHLILGALRATLSPLTDSKAKSAGVQTPTAIIGVRGTVFEAAVALDGATAVAVETGAVAVSADDDETESAIGAGETAEVDPERATVTTNRPADSLRARNWDAWRAERRKTLVNRLPTLSRTFERRFRRLKQRMDRTVARIEREAGVIHDMLDELEKPAADQGDGGKTRFARQLAVRGQRFVRHSSRYQRQEGRAVAIFRLSSRIDRYLEQSGERIQNVNLADIRRRLKEIQHLGESNRPMVTKTRETIQRTIDRLRAAARKAGSDSARRDGAGNADEAPSSFR